MSGTFGHSGRILGDGYYSELLKEITERQSKSETPLFSDFFAINLWKDIFCTRGIHVEIFDEYQKNYKKLGEDLKDGKFGVGIEANNIFEERKKDLFEKLKSETSGKLSDNFSDSVLKKAALKEIIHTPMINLSKAFDINLDINKFKFPDDIFSKNDSSFRISNIYTTENCFKIVLDYFKDTGLNVILSHSPDIADQNSKPFYMFLLSDGKDDSGQKQKFVGLLLKTGIVTEEQFKECGLDIQQSHKDFKFGDSFVDKDMLKKQIFKEGKDYIINPGKSDEISGEIGKF
jgi:hypothetical protein